MDNDTFPLGVIVCNKKGNSSMNKLLEAALTYAAADFSVFPLAPRDKKPLIKTGRGLCNASKDPEQIRKWWAKWPDANIGMPMGRINNIFGIDGDFDDGLEAGWEEKLEGAVISRSPTHDYKNFHAFYRLPEGGIKHGAKRTKGLTIRSDGGYFVVPPSIHPLGLPYKRVSGSFFELKPAPSWILMGGKANKKSYKRPEEVCDGERDILLTKEAGVYRRLGDGPGEILEKLRITNERRCNPPLSEEQLEKIANSVGRYETKGWENDLWYTNTGLPRPVLQNANIILSNTCPKLFAFDEFSRRISYGCETPWGDKMGDPVTDNDALKLKIWLGSQFKVEFPTAVIWEVITKIANNNSYHPVREYLDALVWDGKPRLGNWLRTYVGAAEEHSPEYLSIVGRKFLCGAVARIYRPGIKFDHMPVFEGIQGLGKSALGRALASSKWFCDTIPDLRDKDARLNLRGSWFIEFPELSATRRNEAELVKAYLTTEVDKLRAPYGRTWEEVPRQNVFIGTTNSSHYLKDPTGNRRFWPIKAGRCDFRGLERDRDQLFAEAKNEWDLGERIYLTAKEQREIADPVQALRVPPNEQDEMKEALETFIEKGDANFNFKRFKMTDLFSIGPWSGFRGHYRFQNGGEVLRRMGFESYISAGRNYWKKER